MRTQSICLTLAIVLLCPFASAQWVQTNGPYGGKVYCLAVSRGTSGGTNLFAGTEDGVWLSTDNGTNWKAVNSGIGVPVVQLAIAPDGAGGSAVFAGSLGLFRSTNNGVNWSPIADSLPAVYYSALATVPDGKGGMSIFAGGGDQLFRSSDIGATWQDFSKGLPKAIPPYVYPSISCLAGWPGDSGGTILLAGVTESSAFRTSGTVANWASIYGAGLKSRKVYAFAIDTN